jgi:hypothetical protein
MPQEPVLEAKMRSSFQVSVFLLGKANHQLAQYEDETRIDNIVHAYTMCIEVVH